MTAVAVRAARATIGEPEYEPVPDFDSVEDALAAGLELPCQFVDPDLFFAEAPAEVECAKALCVNCPVRAVCLAAALSRREPWGVWGGQWFEGGQAIGYKRPRGRPRKDGRVVGGGRDAA